MSKEYIKAQTPLPAYFPYPKFLLQMSLSHTARLTYVLLLDRMTLSQKNSWVDAQGRAYVLYPLAGLAKDLQSSISSITRALRELEAARLIERRSSGFSKPNQIFLGVPQTVQKCSIGMVKNEQPDCSKVSNAAGTAVCESLAGNAGEECGAAALGRCWYRQKFHGGLYCQSVQNGSSNAAGWTNISIKPTPSKIRRAK